jgi:hypothetical protein
MSSSSASESRPWRPPGEKCHRGRRRQRHYAKYREWSGHARGIRERADGGGTGHKTNVARETNSADRTSSSSSQAKDQVTG